MLALGCAIEAESADPRSLSSAVADPEAEAALLRLGGLTERTPSRADLDFNPDERDTAPFPVRFDTLSERDVAAFFEDGRLLEGRRIETEVEEIRASAPRGSDPRGVEGVVALADAALGTLTVEWSDTRGTPALIEGPLSIRRGEPRAAVDEFMASSRAALDAAFGISPMDELVWVGSSQNYDGTLEEQVFQRSRDGVAFEEDVIQVSASTAEHRMGAGLVWRIHGVWHRSTPSEPVRWMDESDARRIAGADLGVDLLGEEAAFVRRRYFCATRDRSCRPVWVVRATVPEVTSSPGADGVFVDGETGEILSHDDQSLEYSGSITVNSNFPYDTADQFRAFSRARLVSGTFSYVLDSQGAYTNFNPLASYASVGLSNPGAGIGFELHNMDAFGCGNPINPLYQLVDLPGPVDSALYTANNTTMNRSRALAWNLIQWGMRARAGHPNYLQLDDELYYSVGPGGGGQAYLCGTDIRMSFGMGLDVSGIEDPHDPIVVFHELTHQIHACTRGWSAGCPGILGDPRTHWAETIKEGQAEAFAHWANGWRTNTGGIAGAVRYRTYNGIPSAGDLTLDEAEIDGTDPPGVMDAWCRIGTVYQCSATEACFNIAHGEPRCMPRAPGVTNCLGAGGNGPAVVACRALFPGEWAVDGQCYGTANGPGGATEIPICLANGYVNGAAVWGAMLTNLTGLNGYLGIADMLAVVRDYTHYTDFTAGTDSYRSIMALRSQPWVVDRAFHAVSTESFGWLDDVSDTARAAEVHRIGRGSYISTSFGGTTNATLRFDRQFDADYFLIAVPPNETYEFGATTAVTTADLCIGISTLSGAQVATAGCSDGSSTAALRNATATFSTGTSNVFVASVSNVLGITGATYAIRVRTVGDDFPDAVTSAAGAGVLRPGVAHSFSLDSATEGDLFRYDRPSTAGSAALSFTVAGVSPAPTIEVYFATGTTIPTTPIATATGTATVSTPSVGHYYARVVASGGSGAATITVNAGTTCGTTCSGSGTYASPQPLPTIAGGEVFDRITVANPAADPGTTWANCSNGTHCDWYAIDLADNERLSVTTWGMTNACQLEVAVFAPVEQGYFSGASGELYPASRDLTGSNWSTVVGGQLTYVARRGGTFRIAFRSPSATACGDYWFQAVRGSTDTGIYAPPPVY